MLKIVDGLSSIRFSQLMEVYREGNLDNGVMRYSHLSPQQQLLNAENDFYQYLNEVFFHQDSALYALWEVDMCYMAALRLEPYHDGLLISALETRPEARRNGYAFSLLCSVIHRLKQEGSGALYSHVSKQNTASLALHQKCGFQIIKDYAVYLDGSVMHNSYTLRIKY